MGKYPEFQRDIEDKHWRKIADQQQRVRKFLIAAAVIFIIAIATIIAIVRLKYKA